MVEISTRRSALPGLVCGTRIVSKRVSGKRQRMSPVSHTIGITNAEFVVWSLDICCQACFPYVTLIVKEREYRAGEKSQPLTL
jgi:hypothetical protein